MLQQIIRLIAGGELRYVQMPAAFNSGINILSFEVSAFRILILIAATTLFALTWYLIYQTNVGMELRALTQNREMAKSFGINADKIFSWTFAYGCGLAGLAGSLVSPLKSVSPEMGTSYVVDAFMVVVLGGVESLFGTVASSFILGEFNGFLAYLSNDTIAKAAVFLFIIVLIRFRPQGLFSTKIRS